MTRQRTYQEATRIVDELSVYLDYQNDEREEALNALGTLVHYPDYIDDQLFDLAVKELEDALNDYRENWEMIETERQVTIVDVTLVEKTNGD